MLKELKYKYDTGNIIIKLIMLNLAIHVGLSLFYIPYYLFSGEDYYSSFYYYFIQEYLYFPSSLKLFVFRFWTMFTYMFLHADLWHILMNMLVLYWFGSKLIDLIPSSKVVPIYLLGGMSGALFFMVGFNIFPVFKHSGNLVGASASVMAIVLATATLNPRGTIRFLFNIVIELQYVAFAWVIYNILIIPGNNPGGAFAHLGGAFMGWFYIHMLRKGKDLSIYPRKILNLIPGVKAKRKTDDFVFRAPTEKAVFSERKSRMKVLNISGNKYFGVQYGSAFIKKYQHLSKEDCLNSILSKIKQTGFESLSKDEKDFLDRYN